MSNSSLAPMPEASNHDCIAGMVDAIADDIGRGPKRNDQLAVAEPCGRTTAVRLIGKGSRSRKQCIESALRKRDPMRLQKAPEPFHVSARAS
jgi:hypothetical protein